MPSTNVLLSYEAIAPIAVAAVAAQFPGSDDTDDGGGPYVGIPDQFPGDAVVELFIVSPSDTYVGDAAWKWRIQHDGKGEASDLGVGAPPYQVAAWARSVLDAWKRADERAAEPKPVIHTLSPGNVDRVRALMTAAIDDAKLVRVAWDGGLKVKVGEGMWSPILTRPEQP